MVHDDEYSFPFDIVENSLRIMVDTVEASQEVWQISGDDDIRVAFSKDLQREPLSL